MDVKPYHHGDLYRSLIETGLALIHEEGEERLSLRKVAARCGVSNAAPYAHFKNKDEFVSAIQQYVMSSFSASLLEAVQEYGNSPLLLPKLGKAYVMFFYQNPFYYDFLFSRKNSIIELSLERAAADENHPFEILRTAAMGLFSKVNMPEKVMENKIIAMWALVQGLSSITTMPGVALGDNWEERAEDIIRSIAIPYDVKEEEK